MRPPVTSHSFPARAHARNGVANGVTPEDRAAMVRRVQRERYIASLTRQLEIAEARGDVTAIGLRLRLEQCGEKESD